MRLARSWKWSLVLIGGFFYILSLTDSDIKRHFLRKISSSKESAVNSSKKVKGNNPQMTSAVSSRSNLTENKILEQEMEEFMIENQERKDLIKLLDLEFSLEASGYHKLTARTVRTRRPRAQMFTVVPQKRLAWCRTPKVATTSWARIVLQLYGVKKFAHYHNQMKTTEKRFVSRSTKKKYVSSLANKLRKYTGFMISRHPMARLYSAFRDKILRRSIIISNVNGKGVSPSFSKFLTSIAMDNPSAFNRHWKPNWVLCNPCLYNYDFILKMETFDRDSGALLRKIGAGELAEVNHLNQRGKVKRSDPNYQALLKNVKPHILERVLNIYYLDFVMFGYDIKPFLEILSRKKDEANKTS